MRKRKFKFAKLVRDKIVDGIKKSGDKPVYRILDEKEYTDELKKKLVEEVAEIPKVKNDKELTKELADIQEVIDHLVKILGLKNEDLKKLQEDKNKKAGSFEKRLFVEYVEVEDDSEWIDYYLENPDKYPEIK